MYVKLNIFSVLSFKVLTIYFLNYFYTVNNLDKILTGINIPQNQTNYQKALGKPCSIPIHLKIPLSLTCFELREF